MGYGTQSPNKSAAPVQRKDVVQSIERALSGRLEQALMDMPFDDLQYLHEGACCRSIRPPLDRETNFCSKCWDPPAACKCTPERQFGWWITDYFNGREFVRFAPEERNFEGRIEGWYDLCYMHLSGLIQETVERAFGIDVYGKEIE